MPTDQMVLNRLFGHVNPESYSPTEYAQTISPLIERKLRESPVSVANTHLAPHNRGVSLTLVFERTYSVHPGWGGPNEVLHEHGSLGKHDFAAWLGGLFESADKLTDVTVQDTLGQTHTFRREDVKSQTRQLAESEDAPLDLSALDEARRRSKKASASKWLKKGREADDRIRKRWAAQDAAAASPAGQQYRKKAKASHAAQKGHRTRKAKAGESLDLSPLEDFDEATGKRLGRGASHKPPEPTSTEKGSLGKTAKRAGRAVKRAFGGRKKKRKRRREGQESLRADVEAFLGETSDFVRMADKLLSDSQTDPNMRGPEAEGYKSYLRRVMARKDPSHLTQHEDEQIRSGAVRAKNDLTRLADCVKTEGEHRRPFDEGIRRDLYAVKDFQDVVNGADWVTTLITTDKNQAVAHKRMLDRDRLSFPLKKAKVVHPSDATVDAYLAVGNEIR